MFNLPGMTKDTHPVERQSAKSALLGAGYNLGWTSFAAQLLTGFLGAKPLRYTKADARQLGVTAEKVQDFLGWHVNLEKMRAIPHTCTEQELLVHCLVAKEIIDKYRSAAQPVVDFWAMCQELIPRSLRDGVEYKHKCVTFKEGEIVLPSGLSLRYPELKGTADERGRVQWSYGPDEKKLYGGKLTENIVQAVARCIMTDGMLRIQKRYPCVLTVHDEVAVLVPETHVSDALPWVLEQMITVPDYMPGLPLNADIDAAKRYGDAK
jgi:DNA polymerase